MFGWLSFSVWKCLSQSSLFVLIYCVIVNGQDYGYNNNDCSTSGLACLPLLQCPKVNEIALKIQELGVHETTRKLELLNIINHKLCGGRIKKELHVCCTIDEIEKVEDPSSVTPDNINRAEVYLGSFNKLTYHPVQGDLYLKDPQTLVIRNFVYDGEGPDAFFVVGKRPMRRNRVVIRDRRDVIPIPYESQYPYPPYSAYSRQATSNQGGSYLSQRLRYDDPDIPVLGRFEGQDIELNMPEGVDAEKIRWISLYCRQFNLDFGHVMIDNNPWGQPRTS